MAIDKPSDKIREVVSEPDDSLLDGLVKIAGSFNIPAKLLSLLNEIFQGTERQDRVKVAFFAVCDELERLARQIETMVDTPWFKKALEVLVREAAQSADEQKALQLGAAFARGCFPDDENLHRREELASYLRDLAQLTEEDVRQLNILREVNATAIRTYPNMHDPNPFSENFAQFKARIADLKIHPDDALSTCSRLAGFGLAVEVGRNTSRQAPGEHCFRPTKRGLYMLTLLQAAGATANQAN